MEEKDNDNILWVPLSRFIITTIRVMEMTMVNLIVGRVASMLLINTIVSRTNKRMILIMWVTVLILKANNK